MSGSGRIAENARAALEESPPFGQAGARELVRRGRPGWARGSRSWRPSWTRVGPAAVPIGSDSASTPPTCGVRATTSATVEGIDGGGGSIRCAGRPCPAGAGPPERHAVVARVTDGSARARGRRTDRAVGARRVSARPATRRHRRSSWRRRARTKGGTRSTCAARSCCGAVRREPANIAAEGISNEPPVDEGRSPVTAR